MDTAPMKVIFTHIPKTAGSSIHEGVYSIIGDGRFHVVPTDNDDVGDLLLLKESVSYIGGHLRFPVANRLFGESIFIAALRDPIDRIVSNFFFVIRESPSNRISIETSIHEGFEQFYQELIRNSGRCNLQTRFFADDRKANTAIREIEHHYSLIWDSETTDIVWPSIGALFSQRHPGFPISIEKAAEAHIRPMHRRAFEAPIASNPSMFHTGARPVSYREFLQPKILRMVEEDNSEDLQLYSWLRKNGGVFLNRAKIRCESIEEYIEGSLSDRETGR